MVENSVSLSLRMLKLSHIQRGVCLTPAVVTGVSGFPDSFKKEGLSLTKSHIDNLLYYFSGADLFIFFSSLQFLIEKMVIVHSQV